VLHLVRGIVVLVLVTSHGAKHHGIADITLRDPSPRRRASFVSLPVNLLSPLCHRGWAFVFTSALVQLWPLVDFDVGVDELRLRLGLRLDSDSGLGLLLLARLASRRHESWSHLGVLVGFSCWHWRLDLVHAHNVLALTLDLALRVLVLAPVLPVHTFRSMCSFFTSTLVLAWTGD
jgi:hypothetical protein